MPTYIFDHWRYHLPYAAHLAGITKFDITQNSYFRDVLIGFPPLAHIMMAGLLKLGRLTFSQLVNAVGFLAAIVAIWVLFRQRLNWAIFLGLAVSVPMLLLLISGGSIDLWTGAWLLVAFAALVANIEVTSQNASLIFLIGIVGATLSKMQAWPPACVLIAMNAGLMWLKARSGEISLRQAIIWIILPAALAAVWPLRNLLLFGNPMHPWAVLGFGTDVYAQLSARVANDVAEPLQQYPRPVLFAISAIEATRWWGDTDPFRFAHSGGVDGIHWRMGGWGYLTVLTMLIGLVTCVIAVPRSRRAILAFAALVFVVSITPQAHELRYWIFLPISAALLCALYVPMAGIRAIFTTLAAVPFLFMSSIQTVSSYTGLWELDVPADSIPVLPQQVLEYWEAGGRGNNPLCSTGQLKYQVFLSGPTLKEFDVEHVC